MEQTRQIGILHLVITHTKFLQLPAPKPQGLSGHNEHGGDGPWLQSR